MSQPQLYEVGVTISFIVFYFKLFIYLHQVLVATCGIFSCAMRPLSCAMWGLVPRPGIEPAPPALEAQSLSHWTTGEIPNLIFQVRNLRFREVQ